MRKMSETMLCQQDRQDAPQVQHPHLQIHPLSVVSLHRVSLRSSLRILGLGIEKCNSKGCPRDCAEALSAAQEKSQMAIR